MRDHATFRRKLCELVAVRRGLNPKTQLDLVRSDWSVSLPTGDDHEVVQSLVHNSRLQSGMMIASIEDWVDAFQLLPRESRMQRVIDNCLSAAWKHTKPRKPVSPDLRPKNPNNVVMGAW